MNTPSTDYRSSTLQLGSECSRHDTTISAACGRHFSHPLQPTASVRPTVYTPILQHMPPSQCRLHKATGPGHFSLDIKLDTELRNV